MKAIKAKKIMLDNHLISGKISQGILKAIIHNEEIPGSIILSEAEHEKIKLLQKRYNEKMEELRYKQLPSRNYPFYLIAQDIIQDFSFKESKMGSGKFEILAHRVSNLRPS